MKIGKDTVTTVLGAVGAGIVAAEPVLNGFEGTMHQADYLKLALAVVMAVFGWFTNRKETVQ